MRNKINPIKKIKVKAKNHCIPIPGSIGNSPVAGRRTTSVTFGLAVAAGVCAMIVGVFVAGGGSVVGGGSVTGGG